MKRNQSHSSYFSLNLKMWIVLILMGIVPVVVVVAQKGINNGCLYTLKNLNCSLYLTVDESPQPQLSASRVGFGEPAKVILKRFYGNYTQIWKALSINEKENEYWLLPLKYPLNIVSAYGGQGSPYVQTSVLKFRRLLPNKHLYTVENLNAKACLSQTTIPDLKSAFDISVEYTDCDSNSPNQLWEVENYFDRNNSVDNNADGDECKSISKFNELK